MRQLQNRLKMEAKHRCAFVSISVSEMGAIDTQISPERSTSAPLEATRCCRDRIFLIQNQP